MSKNHKNTNLFIAEDLVDDRRQLWRRMHDKVDFDLTHHVRRVCVCVYVCVCVCVCLLRAKHRETIEERKAKHKQLIKNKDCFRASCSHHRIAAEIGIRHDVKVPAVPVRLGRVELEKRK
jgi:hypothetical protein